MTQMRSIFTKPVDREIEGVVKADDKKSLKTEFEEYVLTNEAEKRIEAFIDEYLNSKAKNGAWISGFFGSGKSHLLKVLSCLMENKEIDNTPAIDLFLPKIKENKVFKADIKKAVNIPSKSILFNIDQKADIISKKEFDALLAVFAKVFDEMCGYYGKQGYIAKFERDLDKQGIYGAFKVKYKETSGLEWEKGREQSLLENFNIAKAYNIVKKIDDDSTLNILQRYREEYRLSIEDFADQVKEYIDSRGKDFRLNFFVDEVGQYIAGNTKLMTNLQTIAESLATKCEGRSWIIVTAQEDMDDVVGQMKNSQGNDFSKIQARFYSKMKLTSKDVSEVIQKRLLLKNDSGNKYLSKEYDKYKNNFKTLFEFVDGSKVFKTYKSEEEFINSYPFVTYQYDLFQSAMQALSEHNAFEGKHSSVGERSMLGVFQQVAKTISSSEIGSIATFDLMYEGIETALKSQVRSSISLADKHLGNNFATKVLKALFLVKYVKGFKATVRNVSILMLENLEQNIEQLNKRVAESLNLLEQQTYIQRNGNEFEFLTNEEKDVENEIKNTDIDDGSEQVELSNIIFDTIVRDRKIIYENNGQYFQFTKKVDDTEYSRAQELAIHIASPFNEAAGDDYVLKSRSMARAELLVIMAPDDRLVSDIKLLLKTDKHIRLNSAHVTQETKKRILAEKRQVNVNRKVLIEQSVKEILSRSRIYVGGTEVEVSTSDPRARIIQGFQELVRIVYPNLNMLPEILFKEDMIEGSVDKYSNTVFSNSTNITEAELEILNQIKIKKSASVRPTLKTIVDIFEKRPYGWYLDAIRCLIGKLFGRGKIELYCDSNNLSDIEVIKALKNTQGYGNVIIGLQEDFSPAAVRNLKDFYSEFFQHPAQSVEARSLAEETRKQLSGYIGEMEKIYAQKESFPFLGVIEKHLELLRSVAGKHYSFYLKDFLEQNETLLDIKENVLDPVTFFMKSDKKKIYREALNYVSSQKPNFDYISKDLVASLLSALGSDTCFKNGAVKALKDIHENLSMEIDEKVKEEIAAAQKKSDLLWKKLEKYPSFSKLTIDDAERLKNSFYNKVKGVCNQNLIANIRDGVRRLDEEVITDLISEIDQLTNVPEKGKRGGKENFPGEEGVPSGGQPVALCVSLRSINVPYKKLFLENEEDIADYLEVLKLELKREIAENKKIRI